MQTLKKDESLQIGRKLCDRRGVEQQFSNKDKLIETNKTPINLFYVQRIERNFLKTTPPHKISDELAK